MLLHDLISARAAVAADTVALVHGAVRCSYGQLQANVMALAWRLQHRLGVTPGARVAVWLDARPESVVACFAATAAGAVFVPVNQGLKAAQAAHILTDSGAQVLVTSAARWALLVAGAHGPALQHVVLVDSAGAPPSAGPAAPCQLHAWAPPVADGAAPPMAALAGWAATEKHVAAIFYTSGSTGLAKGVVLSHRNLVAGAASVASYLGNGPHDTLLAVLPLSFDAGFSQLTTAFQAGACVVLLNYLLPRDVLDAMVRERVTGLTAVPPLFLQLAGLEWPPALRSHLRYLANTGGRMPQPLLATLRARLPAVQIFLMYGLTEAFRSTYLAPDEAARRPDSIGKAVPNAEVLVLRDDGTPCAADEPGELVHRGATVALGYWNDAERTALRFRPLPAAAGAATGAGLPEVVVFSGDTVRRDAEGFLYFIGRRDEMIKTSGYRVSPTEVEEVLYATGLLAECVAFGVDHAAWGQAIRVIACAPGGRAAPDAAVLVAECRQRMPPYMVPAGFDIVSGPLPRNANGKIDRAGLVAAWHDAQR